MTSDFIRSVSYERFRSTASQNAHFVPDGTDVKKKKKKAKRKQLRFISLIFLDTSIIKISILISFNIKSVVIHYF